MTKRWAGWMGLRPGSVARAEDLYTACVRECARYLRTGADKPPRLVNAIGALVAEHTALCPDEAPVYGALLEVGRAALAAGELRLGRLVADSAVALRSRDAVAWQLRGTALEAAGRTDESVTAFARARSLEHGTAA